jgi:hypothetical protein
MRGEDNKFTGYGNFKGNPRLEDQILGGRIPLKWIYRSVLLKWMHLFPDRVNWQSFVMTQFNSWFPKEFEIFFDEVNILTDHGVREENECFQGPNHVRAVYLGPPFSCRDPFMQSRARWSTHSAACRLNAATATIIIPIKANCWSAARRLHARIPAVCCSYLLKYAPTGGTKTQSRILASGNPSSQWVDGYIKCCTSHIAINHPSQFQLH